MEMRTDENGFWALEHRFLSKEEIVSEGEDAKLALIKKRLYRTIWEEMRQYDETRPPFIAPDSQFVRHSRKCKVVETGEVRSARISRSESGFTIYINEDLWPAKKRTQLAHELGHTYLYDVDADPIEPLGDWKSDLDSVRDSDRMWGADEGFAWEVGGQLVVPSQVLPTFVPPVASIRSVLRAATEVFRITKSSMVKRLYWHTHDWGDGSNYWPDSVLIMYPKRKVEDGMPPPEGNSEVFKGENFRNARLSEVWGSLAPIVRESVSAPGRTVFPGPANETSERRPVSLNGVSMRVEAKFVPRDRRVYLLIGKEKPEESTREVPLTYFSEDVDSTN